MKGENAMRVMFSLVHSEKEYEGELQDDLNDWPCPAVSVPIHVNDELLGIQPLDLVVRLESGTATWVRVTLKTISERSGKITYHTGPIPQEISPEYYGAWHL